jgi:choline dehydrogenase-like flavoprotein
LNNRETAHPAGKLLGGSSAINGLFWTPPSPAGIDAWAKLGNANWIWDTLKPYLEKSVSLPAAKGEKDGGPIKVSYTALLGDGSTNPLAQAWHNAHQENGYGPQKASLPESGTGSVGTRLCTMTIDSATGTRSSSDSAYGLIAKERKNVRILTDANVRKVLFATQESGSLQATSVEVDIRGLKCTVHAAKEVILAAGALHTPKILELSGVGDPKRLEDLGIGVILEQQGVGEGLQNHVMAVLPFLLKITPEAASVPSGGHAFSFTRPEQNDLDEILAQYAGSSNHEAVTKSLIEHVNESSEFNILGTYPGNFGALATILSYPFSRGSVHISSKNPEDHPTIDPRYFSHPLDIELLARQVQSSQKLLSSPHFAPLVQAPETTDLDTIKTQLRETLGAAAHHASGTAAMLPREAGGVVGQDLKVYGTTNLRIVDASIFPLIPSGNPISTVYAVAERAADIVLGKAG